MDDSLTGGVTDFPRRIAAVDVGTNTVMCLVADVHRDGSLEVLADEERFARLGEGVDQTGRLDESAMDRVLERLKECRKTAESLNAELIVICATSASRDASNTDVLIRRVREELGLEYRVISGEEEAQLSFRGTLAFVPQIREACVLDIGGGSTEFVAGTADEVRYHVSTEMGSVRLMERFLKHAPASAEQVQAAKDEVQKVLRTIPPDSFFGLSLIEGGGTARVLATLICAKEPAPAIPHGTVREWRDRLLDLSSDEVRSLSPGIFTGREDVAAAALLILDAVMERFGFEAFIAAKGGLRHGIALASAAI